MGKIVLIDFLSTISYWYVNENSLLHDLALRVAEQKQVLNFTTTVKSVVLKLFILWLNDWVCCSFRKLQVCWFLSRHHILQRLGPNELLFFYSLFPIKSAISILIKIWPIWQNFKAKIRNFSDLPIKSSQQIFLSLYFNWRYVEEEEEDCNCTSLPEKEKNKIEIEKTVVGEFLHIIRHFSTLIFSLSWGYFIVRCILYTQSTLLFRHKMLFFSF